MLLRSAERPRPCRARPAGESRSTVRGTPYCWSMAAILTELWVYWLQLAARHSAEARQLRKHSLRGPIGPDKIRATLEELTQSMVAISCATSAIDGFAAAIREVTGQVPPTRTPRPQQVLSLI